MKQLFVPYELAVKLKELGFDEPCLGAYHPNVLEGDGSTNKNAFILGEILTNDSYRRLKAPLCQQVIDWLEDKFGIFFYPMHRMNGNIINYWYCLKTIDGHVLKGLVEIGTASVKTEVLNKAISKAIEIIKLGEIIK